MQKCFGESAEGRRVLLTWEGVVDDRIISCPADCDKSCKKACTGAGPARCVECGHGYDLSQYNVCKGK